MQTNNTDDEFTTLKHRVDSLEKKISKLVGLLELQVRTNPSGPVKSEDYLKIGEEMRVELARYASH